MKNPLWVLLVVSGVLMGVLPMMVSANPMADTDVSITHHIDDGDAADFHDVNKWLVAGGGVCSTIRVNYTGNTTVDIHSVRFTSEDGGYYGSVTGDYTGNLPYYDGIFSPSGNRAGNATIGVHINYSVNGTGYDYYRTVSQPIDHNRPMNIRSIAFESENTIGAVTNITMIMEDAYGNAVTSRYEDATGSGTLPESVTFETTRYAGSGLYNCTRYDADAVTIPVNADGTVVATFKVGTVAGPKYLIHAIPPAYADDTWLTMTGLADAKPHAMSVSVVPNAGTPPYLPADGQSKFYLTYTLYDRFGNPSGNQTVQFMDSISSDVFTQRTNSNGQIMITFGPFDSTGLFTIHAEAMENASVSVDQEVRFTNTSPEEMLLTANPQSMPSADVGAGGADIIAKVMDENGNGVPAEKVTFSIMPRSDYSIHQTNEPTLDALEAYTNADGIATVHFTPGAFETDIDDLNYSATASESCTVVAIWGAKTRSIVPEWKNYPYLRVETEVDPATVGVGCPVDVTVRLIGDGWALYPDPIDVMLCADRSGSMKGEKISSLIDALKIFNGEMTEERDRVGLISFGDDATRDLSFTTNHNEVDSAIDALNAKGWTPMRYGLFLALNDSIENGREGSVQAVILLSDGDYNYYGDPLARGIEHEEGPTGYPFNVYRNLTEDYYEFCDLQAEYQNLSVYANSKNIPVYSIALGNDLSDGGNGTLKKLAQYTGGKYYHAPNASQLADIYTSIAGELKTEAGVNTAMNLNFDTIEVNNVSYDNTVNIPILTYEYVSGASTLVKSWNESGSEGSPNIKEETLNQTDEWGDACCLSFDSGDIGTIHLNQTWQATFRLNVSKAGNIDLFGDESLISFNNGTDFLTLPKTYITAVPDLNATGINFTDLEVYDLKCVEAENGCIIENDLTIQWNLNYSGVFTANQSLYYQNVDDGVWICFGREEDCMSDSTQNHTRKLYVADFMPGEYHLRVWATAMDAPDSIIQTFSPITIGTRMKDYILLQ